MHLKNKKKIVLSSYLKDSFYHFEISFLVILKVYFVSIFKAVPAFFCLFSAYCIYFHSFYFWGFCVLIFRVCLLLTSYCACMLNRVRIFATLSTITLRAPMSVGFSRQEYWSALPSPSPEDSSPWDWAQVSCGSCVGTQSFTTELPGGLKRQVAGSYLSEVPPNSLSFNWSLFS